MFLINIITALKVLVLFAITAAGAVPCCDNRKSPRTPSAVQNIFFFFFFFFFFFWGGGGTLKTVRVLEISGINNKLSFISKQILNI